MKLSKLFKQGKFVITCEAGPPKGIEIKGLIDELESLRDKVHAFLLTLHSSLDFAVEIQNILDNIIKKLFFLGRQVPRDQPGTHMVNSGIHYLFLPHFENVLETPCCGLYLPR